MIRNCPRGKTYKLVAEGDAFTRIILLRRSGSDKSIRVKMNIHDVSQQWYNWQIGGEFIQKAFSMLSNSEREFLISGLLPAEWDEIMKEEE
jgi:hypothetical protein